MRNNATLFLAAKLLIAVLFFSFVCTHTEAQSTYPFASNGGNIALWSPINKCGAGSSNQYKWIGDAAIYPASGFNGGNPYGTITSIAWYCNGGSLTSTTSGNPIPIKIYLKQTSATTLSAQTWSSAISGATLVYSGNTPLTINVGTWYTPALCTPFSWTADNLLVLVECDWGIWGVPTECGTSPNWEYNTAASTHEEWFSNTSAAALAASTGAVDQYRADVRIVVGGSVGGIPPTANAGGNHTLCQGQNTTLSGSGTGTYNWSPSTGLSCTTCASPTASPTTTTTYTLTTSNACGTATDIATVTVTPLPTVNAGGDKTICSGLNATLNGSGTGPYNWSPSATLSNPNISNPVANPTITTTYTVSATNGCGTVTDLVVVQVNNVPAINAGADKTICAGKSATLNGSGGGTYNWAPSTGLSCTTCAAPVASPTSPTTYTVTSTNGCGSATDVVTVTVNSLPTANAGSGSTICSGQSATLNGSGGGTYNWAPSTGLSCTNCASPSASPTTPTTYTLTVTDGNGCTDTDPATVTVNALPNANAGSNVTICTGQPATLTATGGGTYSWNTGVTTAVVTVTPTGNTTYTVTVTNASNCTKNATVSVNTTSPPAANIGGASSVCSGNPLTLTASGGGTYSWTTGSTTASITVSPTTPTTYSVIVSSGSCSDTAATTVSVSASPTASVTGTSNLCAGQSATLNASGGTTYSWNTGSTTPSITVSPTTPTTYTLTAINASGCTDTDVFTVNVAPPPTAVVSPNTTLCAGQSTLITASGGLTYSWSTGATSSSINVSPTTAATYSVIVSAGTCSDTAAMTVAVNAAPTANINTASTTICSGQSATLTATGGGTYSWSTGATTNPIVVSPTSAASYSVVVSNGLCTDTSSVNLTLSSGVTANISSSSSTICSGTNATLTASGGGNYSWSTGSTASSISVSPSSAATYSVVVTIGTCSATASTNIAVNTSPTATVAATGNSICSGQTATLTAGGGGTYLWNTGATTNIISVSPTQNTSYTVTVTSANGCTGSAVSPITVTASPNAAITSAGTTICRGDGIVLTASGGSSYVWAPGGATTSSINVNPTSNTSYTVTVSNGGCTDVATTTVTVNPVPSANAGINATVTYGNSTTLTATGGGTYSWSTGETTASIIVSPVVTTTYSVIVTDANGCTDVAVVTVTVEISCGDFFVPNAFSPNGDNKNDILYVRSKCLKSMHFVIYDRWGVRVFETEDITLGWDGMYKGEISNSAVFNYVLNYELLTGEVGNKKGTVSLIR